MEELSEQPLPEQATCPRCGARATEESVVRHRLSSLGYAHDDQHLECVECGEGWVLGVPIGEDTSGYGDDLRCSCGEWVHVHRVRVKESAVVLDTKCRRCKNWKQVGRETDADGLALVGYPFLTGDRSGATPYGYPDDERVP